MLFAAVTMMANQVVFDPATYDAGSLPEGMSIVEIEGTSYLRVVLNGWNSSFGVDALVPDAGRTHFRLMAKYQTNEGNDSITIDQVNTFLKLVDNTGGDWGELAASGQGSSAEFMEYMVAYAPTAGDTITHFQIAGQETVSWQSIVGDTLWIGKIDLITYDENAIFNPGSYDPDDLPERMWIEMIDGIEYLKVHLNGWNSSFAVDPYILPETATHFTCEAKYATDANNDSVTVDQVNTFLKIVNNNQGGWSTIGEAGNASSTDFTEYMVALTAPDTVTHVQVAGQETSGWQPMVGDTIWLGKILPVIPEVPTVDTLECLVEIDVPNVIDDADYKAVAEVMWDMDSLYVKFTVWDDTIYNDGGSAWSQDNIELYLDMDNSKAGQLDGVDDYQFRLMNDSAWETVATSQNAEVGGVRQIYEVMLNGDDTLGYIYDLAIPFDSLSMDFIPEVGAQIGFDILASDNDGAPNYRDQFAWNSPSDQLWQYPYYWGVLEFALDGKVAVIEDTEAPTTPAKLAAEDEGDGAVLLTWDASTDNRWVAGYEVSQDGEVIVELLGNTRQRVRDLAEGSYEFSVVAIDIYGLRSGAASVDITLGPDAVEISGSEDIKLYPNPATSLLHIAGTENFVRAEVIGMTGKLIGSFETTTINVEGLNDGIYIIKIYTEEDVYLARFMKK